MTTSPRLGLPMLSPGQAQKEFFHNESLQILDAMVSAAVESAPSNVPPISTIVGNSYIVGTSPSGSWSGKAGQIASFTMGGWRFIVPVEGTRVHVKDSGLRGLFRAGTWEFGVVRASNVNVGGQQVVAARQPAIANPSGGSGVDANARAAISDILTALRNHGLIAT